MVKYLSFMRLPQVKQATGLSRSAIYAQIASGSFPKQINLGPRTVAWISDEVESVLNARICGHDENQIKTLVNELTSRRNSYMGVN